MKQNDQQTYAHAGTHALSISSATTVYRENGVVCTTYVCKFKYLSPLKSAHGYKKVTKIPVHPSSSEEGRLWQQHQDLVCHTPTHTHTHKKKKKKKKKRRRNMPPPPNTHTHTHTHTHKETKREDITNTHTHAGTHARTHIHTQSKR